jgi:DNA-binding transcriptional ArsR family regulator
MGAVKQQDEKSKPGARSGPALAKEERQRFEVLHHPWRVRILDVLADLDMSVSQFVDEGFIPELATIDRKSAISKLAYHFRELRRAGALEVVEQNPRRGSTELVCRASYRAHLRDEQWTLLSRQQREAISQLAVHAFVARLESAVHQRTFDARANRHLAWLAMEVDEQGWSDVAGLLNGVLETITEIQCESKERLRASGEEPIRSTWGQVHFESPPLRGALAG